MDVGNIHELLIIFPGDQEILMTDFDGTYGKLDQFNGVQSGGFDDSYYQDDDDDLLYVVTEDSRTEDSEAEQMQ